MVDQETSGTQASLVDARCQGVPSFDLVAMSGEQAFRSLYPIWDDAAETFEQRLKSKGADPKAQALASSLVMDVPLLVGAYRRAHCGYSGSLEDLVVFEGCHRVLAIAVRADLGWRLPSCVGVFVHPPAGT